MCACAADMARPHALYADIDIAEPELQACPGSALPPEGNNKLRNYRLLSENLRAYTPTGDINTSPSKGKVVSKFDVCATISPPRARILELLRPEDPGRDALEAIVRPAPRRGLARPLDEDTRRFLQRALMSPSPQGLSAAATPEPHPLTPEPPPPPEPAREPRLARQRSLAEELREAEEDERSGGPVRRWRELGGRGGAGAGAGERERAARLALAVEEDEPGECRGTLGGALGGAARRLDALLAESRALHAELAGIGADMQAQSLRACRCAAAARALAAECGALRYLDDVVALLKGDVAAAKRARLWPFAIGRRSQGKNYIV